MASPQTTERPQRWDVPFAAERRGGGEPDRNMDDAEVDLVLSRAPFEDLDPADFPKDVPLRGIIANDTRILRCREGEIVVRQGDWGNSAFYILSGQVRVVLDKGSKGGLPPELLGRRRKQKKSVWQAFAQLWRNRSIPEYRERDLERTLGIETQQDRRRDTRVILQDVPAILQAYDTLPLSVNLEQGTFFGELAALGRIPRAATVFAEEGVQLLEIRWQGLRDLMENSDLIRDHIDAIFRERALDAFLRQTPIFKNLTLAESARIAQEARFKMYGKADWYASYKEMVQEGNDSFLENEAIIAEEGNYPNDLIIIRSGLARLSQRYNHGHRTYGYLTPGHIYGYDEFAEGWRSATTVPLKYSLRAIGTVSAVLVPAALVEAFLLDKVPESAITGKAAGQRPTQIAKAPAGPDPTDFAEFLVQHRFVNGTEAMVIDLDRCTRCDDCVRACASAHDNNPRFLRQGPVHHHTMIASACMHCHDPVCMIECPTGAIHRELSRPEVVINDQTCIGCSLCANNCPYNAIRMVDVRGADGLTFADGPPVQQATKCDLCTDQITGPACQNACPHDALVRMDLSSIGEVEEWLGR